MKTGICILLYTLYVDVTTCLGNINTTEYQLIEKLFSKYQKRTKPVGERRSTVNVTFGLEIIQLVEVHDRNQFLKMKAWVRQGWYNEYLTWNQSEWGDISHVMVEPQLVWVPDLLLHNNADEEFPGGTQKYQTSIRLHPNGKCEWNAPATFTSTCKIAIRYFPFDHQKCKMYFSSWAYDVNNLNVIVSDLPIITSSFHNSSQWIIVKATASVTNAKYACCSRPFSEFQLEIVMKRKPLYYVFNVITPCLVLVMNIFVGYYLPPDCGERISLTITVLLAVAVFLQLISDSLPKNSDGIPLLAIFYIVIMVESACSLVTTCIVLIMHHRGNEVSPKKIPLWMRKFIIVMLGSYIGVEVNGTSPNDVGKDNKKSSFTLPSRKDASSESLIQLDNHYYQLKNKRCLQKIGVSNTSDIAHHEMLAEMKLIRSSFLINQPTPEAEVRQYEWHYIAKVLDRFFFRLFFLTVVITTTAILLPVYIVHEHL